MDQQAITEAVKKAKPGLDKYLNIMGMLHNVDVSKSEEFQKAFNGFYRVRQRQPIFYQKFYAFMEKNKQGSPSFEETLRYLYEELDRVEASFSSKLVATINPTMPIWDAFVLKNLGKKPPSYYRKDRVQESVLLYQNIINEYRKILDGNDGKRIVELFDEEYHNAGITDIKKVDFVFWQIRVPQNEIDLIKRPVI
jgi:hypothetical protein